MARRMILIVPLALVALMVFIAVGGVVVRLLWNWLLPPLFGFPRLDFWQALGMLALCRILVGGFGVRGGGRSGLRRRMRERWESLTPEERERFRQRMRSRWGIDPAPGEGHSE